MTFALGLGLRQCFPSCQAIILERYTLYNSHCCQEPSRKQLEGPNQQCSHSFKMASNKDALQVVEHPDLTSSRTGTFYFAFGSNLSTTQMAIRCQHDQQSSIPVAVARLDSYKWIICQRGYANVVSLPADTPASDETTVWGLLYNISAEDEARLDLYEGHDQWRNPEPEINPDPQQQIERPYLQGNWDYNKHYLPVTVTKWLQDPRGYGIDVPGWRPETQQPTTVRVLVYVDELRTQPGAINQEYIGRMNRGIRESVALGLPQRWVNAVLRKDIEADIEVDDAGYVGTAEGYVVDAEATEMQDHTAEREAKERNQANGAREDTRRW